MVSSASAFFPRCNRRSFTFHNIEHFLFFLLGEGVFTTQSFVEGDFLLEYFGELVTDYQTAKRLDYIYKEADLGCFMYYFKYKEKIMWYVI